MRFIILVKSDQQTEAGILPEGKLLAAMNEYNEELTKAGVLLAAEGLQPSAKGARVRFSGDERIVSDGPFAQAKELVAGFWIFRTKSREEAIEWVKRCPNPTTREAEIEIRQICEAADFGEVLSPNFRRRRNAWRCKWQKTPANSRAAGRR